MLYYSKYVLSDGRPLCYESDIPLMSRRFQEEECFGLVKFSAASEIEGKFFSSIFFEQKREKGDEPYETSDEPAGFFSGRTGEAF